MGNIPMWFSSPEDDLSTDMKLMVGQFLSRKELISVCCAEPGWADCFSTYPGMFHPRPVLHSLKIFKATKLNDIHDLALDAKSIDQQWTDLEAKQFKVCCKHLEVQAIEMVGELFATGVDAQEVLVIKAKPLRYALRNQIDDAGIAFHLLHMLSHLRDVTLEKASLEESITPATLHPTVVALLASIRAQKLKLHSPPVGVALPTLKMVGEMFKMEELVWKISTDGVTRDDPAWIIEQYALDKSRAGGDSYKKLTLTIDTLISRDECQTFIENTIQFFFDRAAGANKFIPQLKFNFGFPVFWPLPFFNGRTLIERKSEAKFWKIEMFDYRFAFREQGLRFELTTHIVRIFSLYVLDALTFNFKPEWS